MGAAKEALDTLSGTEKSSRSVAEAIRKLENISVADVTVSNTLTIGETELDEEKLTALLALLN